MGATKEKVEFEIPEGVQAEVDSGLFKVKGEKGEIERNLFHPSLTSEIKDGKIIFKTDKPTQNTKKLMHTYRTHIKNMFKGVTEGITYKLKVCASHFPMTVSVKGQEFEVKNFLGERIPRTMDIPQGVSAKVEGEEVLLEGTDKELVGQTAASIEKLTRRSGFDRRIFQDGIYITEKDGKEL